MDNIKELLIRSLDSELTEQENKMLNEAMAEYPELQHYKQEILDMRASLKILKTAHEPTNFTDNIMTMIENENPLNAGMIIVMERTFKRISYIAAAVILILFGYNAYTSDEINVDTVIGFEQKTMDQVFEESIASLD